MTRARMGVVLMCLIAALTVSIAGSVTSASASDASIKKVIRSYNPKLTVAEGRVISAIGEYKQSGKPHKVQLALSRTIEVLRSLKSAIARQSAVAPRIKQGKRKLEKGLQAVITAYMKLRIAFGEKSVSRSAARAEAKKALLELKAGNRLLLEGITLLR